MHDFEIFSCAHNLIMLGIKYIVYNIKIVPFSLLFYRFPGSEAGQAKKHHHLEKIPGGIACSIQELDKT